MAETIMGIDHGNGNMKGVHVNFPCGLVRYTSEPGRFMNEDILEYIYGGYDVGQIARAMCSDINLVALKVSELNTRGYRFREQKHRSNFLK